MKPTKNHAEIRQWAKKNSAAPAEIKRLKIDGEPSILYFLIGEPRIGTEEIRPITWEDFFARFDLLHLAMIWQDDRPIFELIRMEPASTSASAERLVN